MDRAQDPALAPYAERIWTTADGLRLFARDYPGADGAARLPVVCLHGLTRNSADFADVAPKLAALGRRIVVPDMRGRGRSDYDPQPMNYVPATYAADISGLLDALGVARAVFIGTSMGGIISVALAAKHPKLVAAAVLNDVGPQAAPEGLARIAGYAGKPVEIATWEDAAAYVRRINGPALPNLTDRDWAKFARRTFREDASGRPVLDYDPAISVPIKAGRISIPKTLAWMLFNRFAKGRPTLLLRGALSDLLARETALKMKAKARSMVLAEVDGVGHAPLLTEPQAVTALEDFLARVP